MPTTDARGHVVPAAGDPSRAAGDALSADLLLEV
jgi:hypothetical protein